VDPTSPYVAEDIYSSDNKIIFADARTLECSSFKAFGKYLGCYQSGTWKIFDVSNSKLEEKASSCREVKTTPDGKYVWCDNWIFDSVFKIE